MTLKKDRTEEVEAEEGLVDGFFTTFKVHVFGLLFFLFPAAWACAGCSFVGAFAACAYVVFVVADGDTRAVALWWWGEHGRCMPARPFDRSAWPTSSPLLAGWTPRPAAAFEPAREGKLAARGLSST